MALPHSDLCEKETSARPQPRERSPPNPESASSFSAPCTGALHFSRAASSANAATAHSPEFGANSMQAVECGAAPEPWRSMAALDRTETRNGPPCSPGVPPVAAKGTRHSLAGSTVQPSSEMDREASSSSTTLKGTNFAPRQRTLGDASGGHRLRGGTTKLTSP